MSLYTCKINVFIWNNILKSEKKSFIAQKNVFLDNPLPNGVVLGLVATEYGYVSANEMASITIDASKYGLGILHVEQDKEFEPCKHSAIKDAELQEFLADFYDE